MKIDIFTLEYLEFIFSNFWTFTGTIIILLVITGRLRFRLSGLKTFFKNVKSVYNRKVLESELPPKAFRKREEED
jgi:hypothetical protein